MNILCITHADFETPGVIQTWALQKSYSFQIVKPYRGENLPKVDDFDVVIIMGGPQSPLKLENAPYLLDEIDFIKEALLQNKKILGFCLGAQLIGEALGAKTEQSPEKEVGVYPIALSNDGLRDPLLAGLPRIIDVIHWHNDMPGVLSDSVVLAQSVGCPRQIVRYKPLVYGFQCHLEITQEGIETMMQAVPEDLSPSTFTQSKEKLVDQDYYSINLLMINLLDRFIELK